MRFAASNTTIVGRRLGAISIMLDEKSVATIFCSKLA
jgi:hypothetical protein